MQFSVVIFCLLASAAAAPIDQHEVEVVTYENNNTGQGNYNFSYDLSDGTSRSEEGELKNAGTENEAMSVIGFYSWTATDGTVWMTSFIADENGFRVLENRGAPRRVQRTAGGISPGITFQFHFVSPCKINRAVEINVLV